MTDTDRIARLERLVKTLLRGLAPGTFGVHRTRRADAKELASALAWLNSDEEPLTFINEGDMPESAMRSTKRGKR